MKIEKVESFYINSESQVKLTKTGKIYKLRSMKFKAQPHIQKIDKDRYVYLPTGEVKDYNHTAVTRADNAKNAKASFSALRDILNTNIDKPYKCLFVTLTYKRNMKDVNQLYNDFRKFNMKFRRYCKKLNRDYEYICVTEPQGRGAFHCHVIFIFDKKAPFIPNEDVARLWGHGFTSIRKLKDEVDNIGAYLTAYLTDIEVEKIPDIRLLDNVTQFDIKSIETVDENGEKVNKSYIKGLRLKMYPKGMKIYRCSRGIKKPIVSHCTYSEALKTIGNAKLTHDNTIRLVDEAGIEINRINYRCYNANKKES